MANYKYCNGSEKTLTKYNNDSSCGTVDNKTTLDLEDDAARANMGGDWRMPTKAEFQELIDNTTNQWVTNYNGSGVNGRKFTSKTDTSKYIFIPAAGSCSSGSIYDVGTWGEVWSSSLGTHYPSNGQFLRSVSSFCDVAETSRYLGLPVRGVRK